MFTELRSLLAKRSLTITVAALSEDQIRINVIPHSRPEDAKINEPIKYTHKEEVASVPDAAIKALTTPLSVTGTAEEVDASLSGVLLEFVESHSQLQATFDRAHTEISEAVKAIDERNKNKARAKTEAGAKAEQKDNGKAKLETGKPKPDGTLPLWWTDQSVAPPGTAAPQIATSSATDGSKSDSEDAKPQEKSQSCL